MKKQIKLDRDTKKVLTDQEKIKLLTEHEGWAIVQRLFLKEAADLINMGKIDLTKPVGGNIAIEIGMRQLASSTILSILNDVIGTAQQFDMNQTLTEQVEEGYILRQPAR
jgi:hypothetical protein